LNTASAPFVVTFTYTYAVSLMFLARTLGIILTRTHGRIKNRGGEYRKEQRCVDTGWVKKVQEQEENRGQDR